MSDEDEKRGSKYPPPHPNFLREHQEVVRDLRHWRDKAKFLENKLHQTNVMLDRIRREVGGGPTDPWSDPDHPGHVLILLGWRHEPDESGLCWRDPQENPEGKPTYRALPDALGVACRRLLERFSTVPSTLTRLRRNAEED